MKEYTAKDIRNVGVFGHGGEGRRAAKPCPGMELARGGYSVSRHPTNGQPGPTGGIKPGSRKVGGRATEPALGKGA